MGSDPTSAYTKIIDSGVVGAFCVLLALALAYAVSWLRTTINERYADAKSNLETRYKDNEAQREVLRGLQQAIDANTQVMTATVSLLKGRING